MREPSTSRTRGGAASPGRLAALLCALGGCGDGAAASGPLDFTLARGVDAPPADGSSEARDLAVPDLTALDASSGPGTLLFSDEFEGQAGAPVDGTRWVAEVGGGGWGNREREYYTAADNARLDGSGHLAIVARAAPPGLACWYGACSYTSARLKTQGRFAHAYGRIEARIQIPTAGPGLWPAFWMLGDDIGQAGWPTCGEIDVMENIGREPATIHGTVHGPGYSGGNGIGGPYALPGGAAFAAAFHVYSVDWTPGVVRFSVDDATYFTVTPAALPGGARWVYDHPYFLLLNLAVGGAWPGDPDKSTPLPATMLVDYVRVWAN